MLSVHRHNSVSSAPWVIWLHGLLGSADDWLPVIEQTRAFPSLAVDLPGHGGSHSEPCQGFHILINNSALFYSIIKLMNTTWLAIHSVLG